MKISSKRKMSMLPFIKYGWHTRFPSFPRIVKNLFVNERKGSHLGIILGAVEFKHYCANIFILGVAVINSTNEPDH